jgi:hypothetical protein
MNSLVLISKRVLLGTWTRRARKNRILNFQGTDKEPHSSSFTRFAPEYQRSHTTKSLRKVKRPTPLRIAYDASPYFIPSAKYDETSILSKPYSYYNHSIHENRDFEASGASAATFNPSVCILYHVFRLLQIRNINMILPSLLTLLSQVEIINLSTKEINRLYPSAILQSS